MNDSRPDYTVDIKKYVPRVDPNAVTGIVRHLGIALHHRNSSLVAASDKSELNLLREGFMKKKLGLTEGDGILDGAINDVMKKMASERNKSRVTVCYLLAEKFGRLDVFTKH